MAYLSRLVYQGKHIMFDNKFVMGEPTYNALTTEWNLTSTSFTLLSNTTLSSNYTVDWGDGSSTQDITTQIQPTHTYPAIGKYKIKITGEFPGFYINNNSTFRSRLLKILSWGEGFTVIKSFTKAFYGCDNLSYLPDNGIPYNVNISNFQSTFQNCSKLTSLPVDLFRYNTGVSATGFYATFSGCFKLNSLPTDLFRYNTLVSASGFLNTFYNCISLTSLPADLFRYNTLVSTSGFSNTFYNCSSLTSLPADLFRYNTLVSTSGFYNTFFNCSSLTSLPADLFRYNTVVNTFKNTFKGCSNLETIPNGLFKYNTTVSTIAFDSTFDGCNKLQINPWTFYLDGEQSTRFLNQSPNFTNCFNRTTFTGVQGTAPDLWNCDFGTGTPTKTDCFNGDGNNTTSISNYASIPVEWV